MKFSKIESGASPSTGGLRPRETRQTQERPESRVGRILIAGLLAAVLVIAPSISFANDSASEVSKESGLGAAAAVSSLIYGPTKLIYATAGLIVGGLAWAFTAGDSEVAGKVFTRSLRGDYVITPAMLMGEQRLEFIGRESGETDAPATSVASAAAVSAAPKYKAPKYKESEYDDLGW